jgi:hypothetical protein
MEERTTDIKNLIMANGHQAQSRTNQASFRRHMEDIDDEAIEWYGSRIKLAWAENRARMKER